MVFPILLLSIFLVGCDGDYYFKKGDYAKAYPEFVKSGGLNEVAFHDEVANGSFETRNNAGNQAIHDYYYAAESQVKLGNPETAKGFYQRVVDLSSGSIRIPQDKSIILKDSFDRMTTSIRSFRTRETALSQGETDPYDNSGTKVDPADDYWFRYYYTAMNTNRREFERTLYSTTAQEVTNIEEVKRLYDRMSSAFDSYMVFAAPGGLLRDPNSIRGTIMYSTLESSITTFQRTLYATQGTITYVAAPMQLKEPQLVAAAKAALGQGVTTSTTVSQDVGNEY